MSLRFRGSIRWPLFLALTPQGREMAQLVLRSWDGIPGVVTLMQEDEGSALAMLGLREVSIADLLKGTDRT